MFYALIFISTIFMINSLHSMEIQTKTHYKEHTKQYHDRPIIQEFLLTQKVGKKNNLPQDIINFIQQYNVLLKKEHFEQTFPYISQWHDFRIPISYQYLLAPQHINVIAALFEYCPTEYQVASGRPIMRYALSSKKDYKLFLTLPIEIRECLTKLPQSTIKRHPEYANCNINENNTIYLELPNKYYKEKLIILKKEKHTKEEKKNTHETSLSLNQTSMVDKKAQGQKMLYKLIFLSAFFITSTLNTLPAGGSSRPRLPFHKDKHIKYPRTTKELFLFKKISEKNSLPQDITNQILTYSILLGNKCFEENFPRIKDWHNFSIPIVYHHLLKQKQIEVMAKLFEYYTFELMNKDTYISHYFLRSKKDYRILLKMPIELRKHLTKVPQSAQIKLNDCNLLYNNRNKNIHKEQIIYLGKYQDNLKPKLIVPEEKSHKK